MPAVPIHFDPNGVVNFSPYGTIAVTAATTAGGVSGTFTTALSIGANSVLVYNAGTNLVFVGFGSGSATASVPTTETADATPIAPGAIVMLTKGTGNDTVAAITGTSTSVVYFTAGEGS